MVRRHTEHRQAQHFGPTDKIFLEKNDQREGKYSRNVGVCEYHSGLQILFEIEKIMHETNQI